MSQDAKPRLQTPPAARAKGKEPPARFATPSRMYIPVARDPRHRPVRAARRTHRLAWRYVSNTAYNHGFAKCATLLFWLLLRLLPLCGALIPIGHSGHRLLHHWLPMHVYWLLVRMHGLLEARLLVRRDEAEDTPKLSAKRRRCPYLVHVRTCAPGGGAHDAWRT